MDQFLMLAADPDRMDCVGNLDRNGGRARNRQSGVHINLN